MRTVLYQAAVAAIKWNPVLAVFAKRLMDAKKPFKVVVIAVARKLVVIANSIIRDGTEWDPDANGKASTESAATSRETPVDEAKPDETCNHPEESTGDETVEPEVQGRGGVPRRGAGKSGDRSGKTLE